MSGLDDQTWDLLMKQLNRIEKQNDDQLELLNRHIVDDSKVKAVVERHSVYFSAMIFGLPAAIGMFLKKMGWKD